ncbi:MULTISPECIES: hypothetical protein [Pseudonocardia]|uniref:Uncharacterized protein n=2 Tax=Pseudonocardia TaxID=1847 RepID=A0A1Y2MRK5_PSEAH|nr:MULTISPECIES: hypothetical protein [Pseudonocardia]OSY37846.1 hypothetical protein BG845_04469 [Pseudonocardia autotrophica]TDN72491.1 hypothetical protein C8E95_1548 [Pseudonocardia autotrophica]BBG03200.1 hypothetical protein Pdca_44090 [Pseudonocardia autotrophica]GEC23817.1 hypothetical protein PSA01_08460 [Pseudonocardia saturnea]
MSGSTGGTVIRAVPRDPGGWARVDRVLCTALGALSRDATPPGATAAAARAWCRLSGVLCAAQARPGHPPGPCPDLCLVAVHPADVEPLGRLARELGRCLLPGAATTTTGALARAAGAAGTGPCGLVLELARVHGLLDLDHGRDAELLYTLAGVRTTGAATLAAHDRVAGRVAAMWAAGDPDPGPVPANGPPRPGNGRGAGPR